VALNKKDLAQPAGAAVTARARPFSLGEILDREMPLAWMLLIPTLLILLVFVAYPFLYGIWLSLSDATIGNAGKFVGLQNFNTLLQDSIFRQTVANTFLYTFVTVIFKGTLGIAMALVLNNPLPFRQAMRAAMLLPWVVPTVLSTLAWLWMFDATYSVFNWVGIHVGLCHPGTCPNWLGTAPFPMISIMLVNIWRGIPFFGISLLAGMQAIPEELYEAASIDGANAFYRFWQITLPLLRPVTTVVVLISLILTFADFQIIYILTRGGPTNSTQVFATYAYQVGLQGTQIGEGAAISLFMFPILCIIVFLTLLSLRQE
jgi:multiple sugar transport system permease protein